MDEDGPTGGAARLLPSRHFHHPSSRLTLEQFEEQPHGASPGTTAFSGELIGGLDSCGRRNALSPGTPSERLGFHPPTWPDQVEDDDDPPDDAEEQPADNRSDDPCRLLAGRKHVG